MYAPHVDAAHTDAHIVITAVSINYQVSGYDINRYITKCLLTAELLCIIIYVNGYAIIDRLLL